MCTSLVEIRSQGHAVLFARVGCHLYAQLNVCVSECGAVFLLSFSANALANVSTYMYIALLSVLLHRYSVLLCYARANDW